MYTGNKKVHCTACVIFAFFFLSCATVFICSDSTSYAANNTSPSKSKLKMSFGADIPKKSPSSPASKPGSKQKKDTTKKEKPVEPIPVKGAVPLKKSDTIKSKTPATRPKSTVGDIDYKDGKALYAALQKSIAADKFLGYTEPFDAFPGIAGNDTVSASFIPLDHPTYQIFYHTFHAPDKPYHRRVYGYTVIDSTTKNDWGHFDGNADGIFEQKTLQPKIVLQDYLTRAIAEKKAQKDQEKKKDKRK